LWTSASVSLSSNRCLYRCSFNCYFVSVYYRVYALDGVIPSKNPGYSDDPVLGRISAILVAPPHTARSLKRCLLRHERINTNTSAKLFLSTSSHTSINDASHVAILDDRGPGSTPKHPMALVTKLSVSDAARISSEAAPSDAIYRPGQEKNTPCGTEYRKSCEGIINVAHWPTNAL
jgi:hypothetical protein